MYFIDQKLNIIWLKSIKRLISMLGMKRQNYIFYLYSQIPNYYQFVSNIVLIFKYKFDLNYVNIKLELKNYDNIIIFYCHFRIVCKI